LCDTSSNSKEWYFQVSKLSGAKLGFLLVIDPHPKIDPYLIEQRIPNSDETRTEST